MGSIGLPQRPRRLSYSLRRARPPFTCTTLGLLWEVPCHERVSTTSSLPANALDQITVMFMTTREERLGFGEVSGDTNKDPTARAAARTVSWHTHQVGATNSAGTVALGLQPLVCKLGATNQQTARRGYRCLRWETLKCSVGSSSNLDRSDGDAMNS